MTVPGKGQLKPATIFALVDQYRRFTFYIARQTSCLVFWTVPLQLAAFPLMRFRSLDRAQRDFLFVDHAFQLPLCSALRVSHLDDRKSPPNR